jgi:hypothetical protein
MWKQKWKATNAAAATTTTYEQTHEESKRLRSL